jgi:hypothetical protein
MLFTDKLKQLNMPLPPVSGPFGAYVPAKRVGDLIFVAGQLPMKDGNLIATGRSRARLSGAVLAAMRWLSVARGASCCRPVAEATAQMRDDPLTNGRYAGT